MHSPQSPSDLAQRAELDPSELGAAEPELASPVANGRVERADKARNRTRILAAAAEAFAERGIEAQMDDIAARAGLGVGTLYRHFATKESLMAALVERKFADILKVTRRGVERHDGEPFEVFADVLREGAEVAAADAAAQDVLTRVDNSIWSVVEPTLVELRSAMQILIDRAQRAGTMRGDVSAADVAMIMCGVSATMSVGEWDWRRYLGLVIDGLRAVARDPALAGPAGG